MILLLCLVFGFHIKYFFAITNKISIVSYRRASSAAMLP